MEHFRTLEMTTRWRGSTTIGGYLDRLQGAGRPPWPIETERLRFDYFHGETVHEDNPGLAELAAFGRRLQAYGVPATVYWAQPPVARGDLLFPGEFEAHVTHNRLQVEAALCRTAAPVVEGVITPALREPDFQDSRNGTEHYSIGGRLKVAEAVADARRCAR